MLCPNHRYIDDTLLTFISLIIYNIFKFQIQLVLYETHSELEAENENMVEKAVKQVNRVARLHHANLQGKLGLPSVRLLTIIYK